MKTRSPSGWRTLALAGVAWGLVQASSPLGAQVAASASSARDRVLVSVTVYNQNFGLVREVRDVRLGRGRVKLELGDVPSAIQPETVYLSSRSAGFVVLERNYQYDLLNPQKLLEKYVGREVTVYRYNPKTGRDDAMSARVLSTNGGTVLQVDGEITFNYPGRFSFPEIPQDLIARPTLSLLLDSGTDRDRIEVSYLTGGLNWKADYVVMIRDSMAANLQGWVTLDNRSGASFRDARLQLVAGDVNRIRQFRDRLQRQAGAMKSAVEEVRQFDQQDLFEYHLYTMQRPATILNNESKQITLLSAARLEYDKKLIFFGTGEYFRNSYGQVVSNQKVGVYMDFVNAEDNGLGVPLPAGVMRVYKADQDGGRQFVGEDRIGHTPRDGSVRLKLGESFDVTGDRRQTGYRMISSCIAESTWRLTLHNHKDRDERVEIIEPAGYDWQILATSEEYHRLDAHTFSYDVRVPGRGRHVVTYRIRVRWC